MKTTVKNGIDAIDNYTSVLKNKRLGLITNQTGLSKNGEFTIDILARNFDLRALYAPEHGVYGNVPAGGQVDTFTDERTGLTVYSLYGKNKKPSAEMLDDIDMLVIDIQDIGCRFYTYIYSMAYAMEACALYDKEFTVLDRINPLGGEKVNGNVLDINFSSFVGLYPIAVRHGLTIGEFACFINTEFNINCKLNIVKCEGWQRNLFYDETDLNFTPTSQNITSVDTAFLFSGTCFFEGTSISEGRGTAKPFRIIGAPWLDGNRLADSMNKKNLPEVKFNPCTYTPVQSKYKDELCRGVEIELLGRDKISPFEIGMRLFYEIKSQSGDKFSWLPPFKDGQHHFIDLLFGTDSVRLEKYNPEEFLALAKGQADNFKKLKSKYHLYS